MVFLTFNVWFGYAVQGVSMVSQVHSGICLPAWPEETADSKSTDADIGEFLGIELVNAPQCDTSSAPWMVSLQGSLLEALLSRPNRCSI